MAAPQQIGANVYYVPPPGQQTNVFADFWGSFLRVRLPFAKEEYSRYLASLQPQDKSKEIQELLGLLKSVEEIEQKADRADVDLQRSVNDAKSRMYTADVGYAKASMQEAHRDARGGARKVTIPGTADYAIRDTVGMLVSRVKQAAPKTDEEFQAVLQKLAPDVLSTMAKANFKGLKEPEAEATVQELMTRLQEEGLVDPDFLTSVEASVRGLSKSTPGSLEGAGGGTGGGRGGGSGEIGPYAAKPGRPKLETSVPKSSEDSRGRRSELRDTIEAQLKSTIASHGKPAGGDHLWSQKRSRPFIDAVQRVMDENFAEGGLNLLTSTRMTAKQREQGLPKGRLGSALERNLDIKTYMPRGDVTDLVGEDQMGAKPKDSKGSGKRFEDFLGTAGKGSFDDYEDQVLEEMASEKKPKDKADALTQSVLGGIIPMPKLTPEQRAALSEQDLDELTDTPEMVNGIPTRRRTTLWKKPQ